MPVPALPADGGAKHKHLLRGIGCHCVCLPTSVCECALEVRAAPCICHTAALARFRMEGFPRKSQKCLLRDAERRQAAASQGASG